MVGPVGDSVVLCEVVVLVNHEVEVVNIVLVIVVVLGVDVCESVTREDVVGGEVIDVVEGEGIDVVGGEGIDVIGEATDAGVWGD